MAEKKGKKKPAKGSKKDVAFYPKIKSTKKNGLGKYA